MRVFLYAAMLLSFLAEWVNVELEAGELPRLEAKAYQTGIAPSHITEPPDALFESDSQWTSVASQVDLFKCYGVQLLGVRWATDLDPKAFASFMSQHDIQIGCEFGDFHLGRGATVPDAASAALKQLDLISQAGGEVASIHLDGPVRRMIKGQADNPNALNLDQIAQRMAQFWRRIHEKYPRIRIGLITNLPNWDYTRELAGYNGHYTDHSGFTYLEVLDKLHQALGRAGEKLAFVEVDCPYNYYREKETRAKDGPVDNPTKLLALGQWCAARRIGFHLILNAEPRGGGAQAFHDLTLEYIRRLRHDGVFPDVFLIQSWYKSPEKNLPESDKHTFMGTAKETMQLIRELYPAR